MSTTPTLPLICSLPVTLMKFAAKTPNVRGAAWKSDERKRAGCDVTRGQLNNLSFGICDRRTCQLLLMPFSNRVCITFTFRFNIASLGGLTGEMRHDP